MNILQQFAHGVFISTKDGMRKDAPQAPVTQVDPPKPATSGKKTSGTGSNDAQTTPPASDKAPASAPSAPPQGTAQEPAGNGATAPESAPAETK